jgi:hypothetical protein
MRFAFAHSMPSSPCRAAPRRITQRSQRTPPTRMVSEAMATTAMLRELDEPSAQDGEAFGAAELELLAGLVETA